jgi:hypothetical protein
LKAIFNFAQLFISDKGEQVLSLVASRRPLNEQAV